MSVTDTLAPTREQVLAGVIREYLQGGGFRNGALGFRRYTSPTAGESPSGVSNPALMKDIAFGSVYPEYEYRGNTSGSRSLFEKFVPGIIIDKDGDIIIGDSSNLLNYDKIKGQLMIAKGNGYLAVDKGKVIAFGLKAADTSFIFLVVPVLSITDYFLLVADGPQYSIYKSLRTTYHRLDLHSANVNESLNNSDEYVDKQTYYWVGKDNSSGTFELRKKSIRTSFAGNTDKIDAFFDLHKHEDIDDGLLRSLVAWLNR
jgi:hypothetical protein